MEQKDPYLYNDVNILKNKLNIKDSNMLQRFENDITFANLITIDDCIDKNRPIDFEHLKKIHKHIFGDIYEWAGEIRTIQILKEEAVLGGDSVRYTFPKSIESEGKKITEELNAIDWKSLSLNDKAIKFAKMIAKLWQVHPFREGNTRSVMTFACHFAERNGFPLEKQLFAENSAYTRNALVKASDGQYAEYGYLEKIVKDAMYKGAEKECRKEILKAGYKPNNEISDKMIKLNDHLHKKVSVKDIYNMYKTIDSMDPETADMVKDISRQFQKEELKEVHKKNNLELEL